MILKIRFKNRVFEWWLSINTMLFGLFIIAPPPSMDSPAYYGLTLHITELLWAVFLINTGMFHVGALVIDGRRWWTPLVRVATTASNYFAYALFGIGFFTVDPWSTAVYAYGIMIGSAALVCFARAIKDTKHALDTRETERRGREDGI